MLAGLSAIAQTKSIDIDNLYCPVTYREMPTKPLSPLFFKYSTAVVATKSTEQRVSLDEINDAIYIAGQKKVDNDADPMLEVVVNLGNVIIETTDTKKHNENESFWATCNSLKAQLGKMTSETGLDKDEIEEVIAYFKSIPERYTNPKLKSDIQLRYAAYYNLCRIYLYLDEPEKMNEYADLLIANGYDKKDGEKFKKQADELVKMLARTDIKVRHFNPEDFYEN
jgi:hypothetical protein